MPFVEVTMVEGRTPEQVRALVCRTDPGRRRRPSTRRCENVRVVVREVPATHWAAGDVTIAERMAATQEEERHHE